MTHAPTRHTAEAGAPPRVEQWWRTVEIDDAHAAAVMTGGELCWLSPSVQIAGWSAALRIALDGAARRAAAPELLRGYFAALHGDDGPGPLALVNSLI